MDDSFKRPDGTITLEDQELLKSLGISGMARGLEHALNEHQKALDAMKRIEQRADGLQSLCLDETTAASLAKTNENGGPDDSDPPAFFRDVTDKPFPE